MIRQGAQGDCAREGYWRLRECARASRESQQINAAYTARFHRSDSCMSVRQCAYVEVVIYDFFSFFSFSLSLSLTHTYSSFLRPFSLLFLALFFACSVGNAAIVSALLDAGANVYTVNWEGKMAAHVCAEEGA